KWTGVVIGTTCLLQVGIGMALDSRIEKGLFRYYFWIQDCAEEKQERALSNASAAVLACRTPSISFHASRPITVFPACNAKSISERVPKPPLIHEPPSPQRNGSH
ncbi:MAG: hypothetical protein R6X07_15220, partial [Desulfatiglandales bacterium]